MTAALAGKCVLITGAGGGVGRGVALACAGDGAGVIVATPRENGAETAELVRARGGSCEWVQCDVTRRADVDGAVASALERYGRLDALVHNATSRRSSEPARVEDIDAGMWDDHARVSLRASYYCAQAALPHLRARDGRFVLFTSPAGMEGTPTLPAYGMVKGALRGFAKSLAREWAPHGVNVTLVSPLAASPAMVNAIREDPALAARVASRVPLGRLGDPETDIGPVVAFLVGDGARYITGQTIVVDGGRFMGL